MADKKMLSDDSEEITKEDMKSLRRVFPELGKGGSVSDIERNNAYVNIIKNRTKYKNDPKLMLTDDEIREVSLNREKPKPSPLYDHPRSK